MNNIVLKGRMTHEPELRTTSDGKEWLGFRIAVPRSYAKDKTDFIDCVAFSKTAKFISNYFTKGQEIILSGELHIDEFTDKEGKKRTAPKVNVSQVEFCGNKGDKVKSDFEPEPNNATAPVFEDIDDDEELPF